MKNRKNILIIAPFPPPYHGTSISVEYILNSKYLTERFRFIKINRSRSFSTESKIGKITLEKAIKDCSCLFKLFFYLLFRRISLVYIPIAQTRLGYIRDGIFLLISKGLGKKVVVHLHGGYFRRLYETSPFWFKWFVKVTLNKIDAVIVLSESLKSMFNGLIPNSKVKVVENCVDDEIFINKEEINRKFERIKNRKNSNSEFKVLFLSNFLKPKGYMDVLSAAISLRSKNIAIKFLFAGLFPDENEKKEVLSFIERNNIKDYIEILGFVSGMEKRKVLIESDIFVLPTYYPYEGVPISILEAMAVGLPIITTKRGGIPDVVEENLNGFFIEPGDIEALVQQIVKIYEDPELHLRIAKANIEKSEKRFRRRHYETSLANVFEETLGIKHN